MCMKNIKLFQTISTFNKKQHQATSLPNGLRREMLLKQISINRTKEKVYALPFFHLLLILNYLYAFGIWYNFG